MKKYMIYNKKADFDGLAKEFDIDPVAVRVAINRDVSQENFRQFLNPSLEDFNDPHLLKDADKAAELLKLAIEGKKKIRIIGDYDIDGVNSTYILLKSIRELGGLVDYAIPHRVEDGYGINPQIVQKAIDDGIDFVITCDNGVAAIEAFELAKEADLTCIITDHHELMFEEVDGQHREIHPHVDALVNPKQEGDRYPFAGICGATVAWKVCQCLYEAYGRDISDTYVFLENVAFATVGDVMELVDENRSIVSLGLKALTNTSNFGFRALIDGCGIEKEISAYDVGFRLGPCINSSGRLDSAKHAVELLLSESQEDARQKAEYLISLNAERQELQHKAEKTATKLAKEEYSQDKILVIYIPNIHESICGIIAGRVREACDKATIVLTDGQDAIKGSARSVDAYNMYQGLHECLDLFSAFGGHPMAAGLTLKDGIEGVEELRKRLNENCKLTMEELAPKEMIDVAMPLSYVSFKLIDDLARLEPFGNGNKKPCFAVKNVPVLRASYIGKEKQYLKFVLSTGQGSMDALYFKDASLAQEVLVERFGQHAFDDMLRGKENPITISFTYYPDINEYRGFKNIQAKINDLL